MLWHLPYQNPNATTDLALTLPSPISPTLSPTLTRTLTLSIPYPYPTPTPTPPLPLPLPLPSTRHVLAPTLSQARRGHVGPTLRKVTGPSP